MILISFLAVMMITIIVGLVILYIQNKSLDRKTREAMEINNQLREEMTEHIHVLVSELNEKLAHRD